MTDCTKCNLETEIIEGHCSICDTDIYPGEGRLTTLEYGTCHWDCYEEAD